MLGNAAAIALQSRSLRGPVVLLPVVGIASLVFSIMAAMAENQNRPYKYPFSIKIVK